MTGNTFDWTSGLYCPYPYEAGNGREDLAAEGRRVARGGSWHGPRGAARAASRLHDHPDYRDYALGFRVGCVAPIF